jgi:hypothetical protein
MSLRMQEKGSVHLGEKEDPAFIPDEEELTLQERRRLTWKLDIRLLPCIWIIYFGQSCCLFEGINDVATQ